MPRNYFQKRANSFYFAIRGILTLVRTQPNAVLHLLASVAAICTGWYFEISNNDWLWVASAIAFVWAAEAFNTALEFLTDLASPEFHPLAEKAKDVAAAGVLMAAGYAVVVGCLVFGVRLL